MCSELTAVEYRRICPTITIEAYGLPVVVCLSVIKVDSGIYIQSPGKTVFHGCAEMVEECFRSIALYIYRPTIGSGRPIEITVVSVPGVYMVELIGNTDGQLVVEQR